MPNTKSAFKEMKTSAIKRDTNRGVKSGLATIRRKFLESVEANDASGSEASFRQYCSDLDKAVKKGVIKPNNASRRKSRAAARLASKSA